MKKKALPESTKDQGQRLTDLLKSRKIRQSHIYNKYMTEYDLASRKVMFSDYCHGKREIPRELLIDIANELNVDVGYLLGADKFKCNSYAGYLMFKQVTDAPFDKYDFLWKMAGYTLIAHPDSVIIDEENTSILDTAVEYGVSKDGVTKDFTIDEMEKFYSAVIVFINDYFNKYDENIMFDDRWITEELKKGRKKRRKGGDAND